MRKSLKINPFAAGDFAFLKKVSPLRGEVKYGWLVDEVFKHERSDKFHYRIKNLFTGETKKVNRGQLVRFHKPLFKDHQKTLISPASNMQKLQEQEWTQEAVREAHAYAARKK